MSADHKPDTRRNWPVFIILALMPLAMIAQGSLAFWNEHYEQARYGVTVVREGMAAQMIGLLLTSVGWGLFWALTPLVGAPRRAAIAMAGLAGFWAVLFLALSVS